MKFKQGDLITGISKSYYNYTNSDAIMKVVEDDDSPLSAQIICHNQDKDIVGNIFYSLNEDLFKHIPIINPLNRKLYPNYIEWEGYLLPEKVTENLKENLSENNQR